METKELTRDLEQIKHSPQNRLLTLQPLILEDQSQDENTLTFSVSSELPVERWWGNEVLQHSADAINLERLPGMVFMWDHGCDPKYGRRPLGKVIDWKLNDDRRCVATIRWSNKEWVEEFKRDVADGVLTNISFGYEIDDYRVVAGDDRDTVIATRWTPMEVSLVAVPADATVGIGRSATQNQAYKSTIEPEQIIETREKPMGTDDKDQEKPVTPPEQVTPPENVIKFDVESERAKLRLAETERIRGISALCKKHNLANCADEWIDAGKTIEEARAMVLEKIERSQPQQQPIGQPRDYVSGFGEKENKQYSMLRLLRSMIPDFPNEYGKNCFEREVSQQIARQTGGSEDRMYFPTRNLSFYGQRDTQNVGSPALGGNLVATDLRADMWIEALRNKAVVLQMGARFITGLKGNVAFPKETGVITADWIDENDPAPETNFTVGQIPLSPKQVAAYTTLTRTLLLQSTPDAEMIARDNLVKAIALKIDQTALYGSGVAPVPTGIANQVGIKTVSGGFGDPNGGVPSYEKMVQLMGLIESENADINGLKWIINSKTKAKLMTTPLQGSGVEGNFIIRDGATNLISLPYAVSNQVRSNLTKGSGTGLSEIYLGDWSQLYVGEWEGLSLAVNYNGTTFRSGGCEIVAFQTLDMNVAHAESFGMFSDAVTV